MLSKLLQAGARARTWVIYQLWAGPRARAMSQMIPASQYDLTNVKRKKFQLTYALREYWELIPMFVTVCFALSIMTFHIFWATKNKVDVVFSTHSCNNISRTMNLRKPTVHKMVIINQRYEPWPEMQDVLDKMRAAEHKAFLKATTCSYEVDVVFTSRSRDNISRTMDLRNPSIHKMITINQRYEPWPEMQAVLDKMVFAHKRSLVRAHSCSHP